MSDKEIKIDIKTKADTSGANQVAEALKKVKEAATPSGNDAFASYEKGAIRAEKVASKLSETLGKITTSPDADPFAKVAKDTARDLDVILQKQRELMKVSKEGMDLAGIDEATNKIKQLSQAYDQLLDSGKGMSITPDKDVSAIIAIHEKRTVAAEKAFDREEAASARAAEKEIENEAKKMDASQKYFTTYEAGQKRIQMTLKQLYAEQERYNQKLREAQTAGDAGGIKDSVENLKKLNAQINTVNRQAEVSARRMANVTNRFRGMAMGAIQATSAMSGMTGQMGKVASVGSSVLQGAMFGGAWGAAFGAAVSGVQLFIDKVKEADDALSSIRKKVSDEFDDAVLARQKIYQESRIKDIQTSSKIELNAVKEITREYERQRDIVSGMLADKLREIDVNRSSDETEFKIRRNELESKNIEGKLSDKDYRLGILKLEREQEDRRMQRERESSLANVEAKKLNSAGKEEEFNDKYKEYDKLLQLPSADEVSKLYANINVKNKTEKLNSSDLAKEQTNLTQMSAWDYAIGLSEKGRNKALEKANNKVEINNVEDFKKIIEFDFNHISFAGIAKGIDKLQVEDRVSNLFESYKKVKQSREVEEKEIKIEEFNGIKSNIESLYGRKMENEEVVEFIKGKEQAKEELKKEIEGYSDVIRKSKNDVEKSEKDHNALIKKQNSISAGILSDETTERKKILIVEEKKEIKKQEPKLRETLKESEERESNLKEHTSKPNLHKNLQRAFDAKDSELKNVFNLLHMYGENGMSKGESLDIKRQTVSALEKLNVPRDSETWEEMTNLVTKLIKAYTQEEKIQKTVKNKLKKIDGTINDDNKINSIVEKKEPTKKVEYKEKDTKKPVANVEEIKKPKEKKLTADSLEVNVMTIAGTVANGTNKIAEAAQEAKIDVSKMASDFDNSINKVAESNASFSAVFSAARNTMNTILFSISNQKNEVIEFKQFVDSINRRLGLVESRERYNRR